MFLNSKGRSLLQKLRYNRRPWGLKPETILGNVGKDDPNHATLCCVIFHIRYVAGSRFFDNTAHIVSDRRAVF